MSMAAHAVNSININTENLIMWNKVLHLAVISNLSETKSRFFCRLSRRF